MRIIRWFALTAALGVIGSGVAAAAGLTAPKTDKVKATFVVANVSDNPTWCQGDDGYYIQTDEVWKGKESSKDPRLAGKLEIDNHILKNLSTGAGVVTGTMTLRGTGGAIKYKGTFTAAGTDGLDFKGLLTADVTGGGTLVAPFSAVLDPSAGTISGEFGKDPALVTADPAVIQSGSC